MPVANPSILLIGALRTRLLTVSGLPAVRAWDNVLFEPTPGTPYVEDQFFSSTQRAAQLGPGTSLTRSRTLYQINLVYPEGQGVNAVLTLADKIAAAMRGTALPIAGNADPANVMDVRVGPRIRDNQWITVPVTCTVDLDF